MPNEEAIHSVTIIEQTDPTNLTSGGIDTIIHDFIKFSSQTQFSVVGGTSNRTVRLGKWMKVSAAGVQIDFLPVCRIDKENRKSVRIPDSFKVALGVLRHFHKIDRGNIHVHRIELGFIFTFLRRRHMTQFLHNNSTGLLSPKSDSLWRYMSAVYRLVERWTLVRADVVVLFNKGDSSRINAIAPALVVAETWFDPEHFTVRNEQISASTVDICWVGRFESQKDPLLAIDVLAELHLLGHSDATLTMVGTGSLMPNAIARAKELGVTGFVNFHGLIPRSQVASILKNRSLLLMTSHYEGSPTVLVEAAAIGLPVVGTVESDPDGVIISGRTGEIRPQRDARELATCVLQALNYSPRECRDQIAYRSAPIAVPALLALTLS